MTDDAYRDLTPTQRAVRDAFVRDVRTRPNWDGTAAGRVASATGLPLDTVRTALAQLGDMATAYWSGKGAAA